jgi:hypothetical protein
MSDKQRISKTNLRPHTQFSIQAWLGTNLSGKFKWLGIIYVALPLIVLLANPNYKDKPTLYALFGFGCVLFLASIYMHRHGKSRQIDSHDYEEFRDRQLRSIRVRGSRVFFSEDILDAMQIQGEVARRRALVGLSDITDHVQTVDGKFLTKSGLEKLLSKRTDRSSILVWRQLSWSLRDDARQPESPQEKF